MELKIEPYEGMGPIQLGTTLSEANKATRKRVEVVRKLDQRDEDPGLLLAVIDEGIRLEYDREDRCVSIEAFPPTNPVFQGRALLRLPVCEVIAWLQELDGALEVENSCYCSLRYGLSIYAPFYEEEPNEPADGVMVFEQGYYENEY